MWYLIYWGLLLIHVVLEALLKALRIVEEGRRHDSIVELGIIELSAMRISNLH